MSNIPQTDTHLTFAAIDTHVTSQSGAPAPAGQTAYERLLARYSAIRPILAALAVIPLIPVTWRAGLMAFMAAADEAAVLIQTPLTAVPEPIPVNPDFKAGKDQ